LLTATALVQIMTPGLAFFYSGLVGEGRVLSTMMMCIGTSAVVTILWSLVGFSLAFAPGGGNQDAIGWGDYATLDTLLPSTATHLAASSITVHTFAMFQLMFSIIAAAIICGAVVGKMKWVYWMLFAAMWHLGVYCPLAHWIFDPRGWLSTYGVIDFAGGMVIHVSSGVSAFVLAWLVGGKLPTHPPQVPHNVPFVLLGAALLWFGWFGFNAGSAVSAGYQAGLAFTNTQLGAATALLTWNLMELAFNGERGLFTGRPTAVGSALGTVAGLVGITPAAGVVSPMWALFIGFFTALSVFFVPRLLRRFTGVDDVLDCFAVHGVGGMVGAALTGLFANPSYQAVTGKVFTGSFYRQAERLGIQCAGISVTILMSVVGTVTIYGVLWAIARMLGDTVCIPADMQGQADLSQHGESAYFSASGKKPMYAPHSSLVVRSGESPKVDADKKDASKDAAAAAVV